MLGRLLGRSKAWPDPARLLAADEVSALGMLEQPMAKKTDHRLKLLRAGLQHEAASVRRMAALQVEHERLGVLKEDLRQMLDEAEDWREDTAQALVALCALEGEEVVRRAIPILERGQLEAAEAALAAVFGYGKREGQRWAKRQLSVWLRCDERDKVAIAAAAVGRFALHGFANQIAILIQAPDTEIRLMGLQAAKSLKSPILLPEAVMCIAEDRLAATAMEAVVAYGEDALPLLNEEFKAASYQRTSFLIRLVQVLAKIGGLEAEKLLFTIGVSGFPLVEVEYQAVAALAKAEYPANSSQEPLVLGALDNLSRRAHWLVSSLDCLRQPDEALLSEVLAQEFALTVERIHYLMNFLAPGTLIAEPGHQEIDHSENRYRQMRNALPGKLFQKLSIIFFEADHTWKRNRLDELQRGYHLDAQLIREQIAQSRNPLGIRFRRWTLAVSLFTCEEIGAISYLKSVVRIQRDPDWLLAETAWDLIEREAVRLEIPPEKLLYNLISPEEIPMIRKKFAQKALLEIEKVAILKRTSLFSKTPESLLVEVARMITQHFYRKGTEIFVKGNQGDAMYIIYQGEVGIRDGQYLINTLVDYDFFGELGLLDAGTRSATAMAEKDVLLLRLDQEHFYELIAQRPEVTRGIMHVLCERIRGQNQLIASLKANYSGQIQS